jgi:RHS repeat-associated protein
VTYTPDSAGRLVSAADGNGTNYVVSASYNPDGSLKNLLNGSTPALNQSFQYTPRLQLCRITTLTAGASPTSCTDTQNIGNIMDRGYDFHAGNGTPGSGSDNGNVFGITNYRDTNRSQAFTYDSLNRLTSAWSSANSGAYSWGENYSIDAWGNLQISPMGTKAHGGNFTLSGNAQNRPTGLPYDAAGNLMSYVSATYTYDQENRLSSTAGMSYTYDGNGERVLKSNSSTGSPTKRYWSMGGNTLAEDDGSGNLTAEYIYFGDKRVARIDLPANTVHYYLSDHLGSTSLVANAAGAIEEESDYYPFGTEVTVTNPGVNELKFTGKRRDTESQLDYFEARYYGNNIARFISADPFSPILHSEDSAEFDGYLEQPQNWNRYTYVWNSPLRLTDPSGLNVYLVTYTTGNSSGDKEFKRAAETRASQIEHRKGFDSTKDKVLIKGIATKEDFKAAIKEANSMEKQFGKVGEVDLFSHSGAASGPVLHGPDGKGVQFSQNELNSLKVNWAEGAQARFYGCNTADFAQAFANAQGVSSYGYNKWADFSSSPIWRVGPYPTGPLYLAPGEGIHNGGWWYIGSNRSMDTTMQQKDPLVTPKK